MGQTNGLLRNKFRIKFVYISLYVKLIYILPVLFIHTQIGEQSNKLCFWSIYTATKKTKYNFRQTWPEKRRKWQHNISRILQPLMFTMLLFKSKWRSVLKEIGKIVPYWEKLHGYGGYTNHEHVVNMKHLTQQKGNANYSQLSTPFHFNWPSTLQVC